MKIIPKFRLTVAIALTVPVLACAATYDDLINSAKMGDTRELSQIAAKGASLDTTDIDGNTLLMLAARDGHADTVDFLIKSRVKLNARNSAGDTALRLAAFRGHQKVVELLLAGGAAVNMQGWTPLAYAAFSGHLEVAKLLIKSGAEAKTTKTALNWRLKS